MRRLAFTIWLVSMVAAGVPSAGETDFQGRLRRALWDTSREVASAIPWPHRDIGMAAVAQARLGDADRAYRTLELTDWGYNEGREKQESLAEIAYFQALWGDAAGAIQEADSRGMQLDVHDLCRLAEIAARRGETEQANRLLARALAAARGRSADHLRMTEMAVVARSQAAIGDLNAATETLAAIRAILADQQEPGAKAYGLSEVGYALAGMGREEEAREAFAEAFEIAQTPKEQPLYGTMLHISECQDRASFKEDATDTLGRIADLKMLDLLSIERGESPDEDPQGPEQTALYMFTCRQAQRGRRGLRWAASQSRRIKNTDWQGRAVVQISKAYAQSVDPIWALALVGTTPNLSRRAEAALEVALVQHLKGDSETALRVARSIEFNPFWGGGPFEFDRPETWGELRSFSFDSFSADAAAEDAADLAAVAMRLHLALGHPREVDYAEAFQEFLPVVLRKLARTHAREGDPEEAFAWCVEIKDAEGRLAALIGLSEGVTSEPIFPD